VHLCLARHPTLDRQLGAGEILAECVPGLDPELQLSVELATGAAKVPGQVPDIRAGELDSESLGVQLDEAVSSACAGHVQPACRAVEGERPVQGNVEGPTRKAGKRRGDRVEPEAGEACVHHRLAPGQVHRCGRAEGSHREPQNPDHPVLQTHLPEPAPRRPPTATSESRSPPRLAVNRCCPTALP
jgi:hypothetical protein